jgi:hypothetical protein
MSLLHDVLSFLAKCRGADVYQATVQAFGSSVCVQTFASTGRVDHVDHVGDGHDLQPQESLHSRASLSTFTLPHGSIPLPRSIPSLRRGGRRHRVSISARRLRASCGRGTELLEGAVAARAVQAEALRRIRGGLPQQDENPITEPRPKRPRWSGRPRRGAHRPD